MRKRLREEFTTDARRTRRVLAYFALRSGWLLAPTRTKGVRSQWGFVHGGKPLLH